MKIAAKLLCVVSIISILLPATLLADGTEALGDPSIDIGNGSGVIVAGTGLIDQDPYDPNSCPDCTIDFCRAFGLAARAGTAAEAPISIVTPVIRCTKAQIVRRGLDLGAPLHLTWSCYRSSHRACGRCDSCALRLQAFREAGVADPVPYEAQDAGQG